MAKARTASKEAVKGRRRAAATPEERDKQMIALAYNLVEQRLLDGTATSQETVHFLKLGSKRERIEEEILERQKELISAKTEAYQSSKRVEELYANALSAMRLYSGNNEEDNTSK